MNYEDEVGLINGFKEPLGLEEYSELFDKSFGNISDKNERERHLEYQRNIIKMFKEFYFQNDSSVIVQLWYFDKMDDLGLYEEENLFLYDELEKKQLKNMLSSLSGEELLYEKKFKIEKLEDMEIILKFQLRTYRTVDFYFDKLKCMLKGSYEYNILVFGDFAENEYNKILKENNLYYKKLD